jgi:hypothetical protein
MDDKDDFPEDVVKKVFGIVGGRCECRGCVHHSGQCVATFRYHERATSDDHRGWQADHEDPNGGSTHANCRIMCVPCHKNTPTYGRHP